MNGVNDKEKLFELQKRLESNFNFDLANAAQELDSDSAFFKFLQQKLAARIQFFINTNMDKLLQALYRIDISESETDKAFHLGEVHKVSMKLAELIIVRQLQKLDYSKKFNNSLNEVNK
jgi:hypothetical protein